MSGFSRICLIGFGEVGQILAEDLAKAGVSDIAVYDILFEKPASIPAHALATHKVRAAASAADRYPFTEARFAQAEASGRPVLVDISATWCPVCQMQKKIIARELMKPAFAHTIV